MLSFTDASPTQLYTLSLHDALPIWVAPPRRRVTAGGGVEPDRGLRRRGRSPRLGRPRGSRAAPGARSEEHTSELQSLRHLVCRLLLEKKKKSDRWPPKCTHWSEVPY